MKISIEPDLPDEIEAGLESFTIESAAAFLIAGYKGDTLSMMGIPQRFSHVHGPYDLLYERLCGLQKTIEQKLGSTND